jgi:hypothetical protein
MLFERMWYMYIAIESAFRAQIDLGISIPHQELRYRIHDNESCIGMDTVSFTLFGIDEKNIS